MILETSRNKSFSSSLFRHQPRKETRILLWQVVFRRSPRRQWFLTFQPLCDQAKRKRINKKTFHRKRKRVRVDFVTIFVRSDKIRRLFIGSTWKFDRILRRNNFYRPKPSVSSKTSLNFRPDDTLISEINIQGPSDKDHSDTPQLEIIVPI